MRIYVDADACPVKELVVNEARRFHIPVVMLIDTSHELNGDGYEVITVGKGRDAVDLRLMNLAAKGDIVVTQDYGLAALALGKGCGAIHPTGMVFTNDNMDSLLAQRHYSAKQRRAGGRGSKQKKRTKEQDSAFAAQFHQLVEEMR